MIGSFLDKTDKSIETVVASPLYWECLCCIGEGQQSVIKAIGKNLVVVFSVLHLM